MQYTAQMLSIAWLVFTIAIVVGVDPVLAKLSEE